MDSLSFKKVLQMYNNRQITENELKRWYAERMQQQFDLAYLIGKHSHATN